VKVLAISLALASALVAFVALPALSTDEQPAAFEPVAPVASLMTGLGSGFSRVKDLAANTDEDRRLARLGAWSEVMAELSNINTLHGPDQAYRDMAADTRDIALELASTTRADTVGELQLAALIARLDVSCTTCHDADY
jgi:hypothetical protein